MLGYTRLKNGFVEDVLLEIWFGENVFFVVTFAPMNSPNIVRLSFTLKLARATALRFSTGCCSTAARPVSQAHPYFAFGVAQSFSS